MPLKVKIAPSILSANFSNFQEDCSKILPHVDWLHVDVMDGHFVPNLTIGAQTVKALRKDFPTAFLDCHLMVSNPGQWVRDFAAAGASQYTFHIEAVKDVEEAKSLCKTIKELQMRPSISIKPNTQVSAIAELVRNKYVENVLVMTVEPGFGGQSFLETMVSKVEELRSIDPEMDIEVDGGINSTTAKLVAQAGGNVFVAGSSIFGKADRAQAATDIRQAAVQNLKSH